MDAEIARIDRLASDPDAKLQVVQTMAEELGTHRNHLLLLKRQGTESFGQIYVRELRQRGLDDAAVLRKLRAIGRETRQEESGWSPVAYVSATAAHSSTGTIGAVTPEIGVSSRRFAVVAGVPVYRISTTGRNATGIGDAFVSLFARQPLGEFAAGANLTVAAPTGDSTQGLGAGRVSVDINGTLERRFERLRAFVTPGYTNSLYDNVGYQRPFISNGNSVYVSGGADYRLHRTVTAGLGGFRLHAVGDQKVISQMAAAARVAKGMPGMPPGHMTPGAGAGAQTTVKASDVSDWGATGWVSWQMTPIVALNVSVARSVPFDLTTVRAGIGFNLSRLFGAR
jgi:hypothetical protein